MSGMIEQFTAAAEAVGAQVREKNSYQDIAKQIARTSKGPLALSKSFIQENPDLTAALTNAGVELISDNLRQRANDFHGGLTWSEYGLAETGSVLIQSTDEEIRLCSTLSTIHYVLLNRTKIIADAKAATPIMRDIFTGDQAEFVAWITGPSRTADIERVLTIGVHGPKELHIFLLPDNIEETQS